LGKLGSGTAEEKVELEVVVGIESEVEPEVEVDKKIV